MSVVVEPIDYPGSITPVVNRERPVGTEKLRLGDLQLRIMQVLWEHGTATVADVHDRLEDGAGLAYTTIATMLRKMEDRGLVGHSQDGRKFIYTAAVAEADVTRTMADDIVDRLFEGSVPGIVHHLLNTARDRWR